MTPLVCTDADPAEVSAMVGVMREVVRDLAGMTDVQDLGGSSPSSKAMAETDLGLVTILTGDGHSWMSLEPGARLARALAPLRIGDPEQRPVIRLDVVDDRGTRRDDPASASTGAMRARMRRGLDVLERMVDADPAPGRTARALLRSTAEAMAAWGTVHGEDAGSFATLFAPTPGSPLVVEWGAFFDHGTETGAVDAWAAARLPVMESVQRVRENQVLLMRIGPVVETARCGLDPVETMRRLAAHPDMPS